MDYPDIEGGQPFFYYAPVRRIADVEKNLIVWVIGFNGFSIEKIDIILEQIFPKTIIQIRTEIGAMEQTVAEKESNAESLFHQKLNFRDI